MNFNKPMEQPATIRVTHMAGTIAQPVDISINDQPIIRGLGFRQTTQVIPLPQGKYTIKVYSTMGNQLLFTQNLDVMGNQLITIRSKEGTNQIQLVVTEEQPKTMPMFPQPGMGMNPMMPQQPGMGMNPMMPQQPGMGMNPMMPQQPEMNFPQPGMGMNPMMPQQPEMNFPQQGFGMNPMMPQQPEMNFPQPGMGMNPMMPQPGMGGPGFFQMTGQCPAMQQPQPYWMQEPQEPNRDAMKRGSKVRFAHFSPNAPAVDITLPNGTILFRNIPYKGVTEYIDIAPGVYILQVRPTGMDQVVLTVPNFSIGPNERKTIYAIGLVNGTPPLEAFVLNDQMRYE